MNMIASITEAGSSERSASNLKEIKEARSGEEPASSAGESALEVKPRKRRNHSWTERMSLLREYEALPRGESGLFLRRHGLYSSLISAWRKQRNEKLETSSKRGRKPKPVNPLAQKLAEAERENRKLKTRNVMLEKVIEVQKKISEAFGLNVTSNPNGN